MFDIPGAIGAGSALISKIIDKIAPDADLEMKAKLNLALVEMQNEYSVVLKQLEINNTEAASSAKFVAGWRPFVGWVCGSALAYVALVEPFARFIAVVAFGYAGEFPAVDTEITLQVLLGLLGLAGMRSFDKARGGAR